MRSVFVYILSSETGVLYTGVTNDLVRRIEEHRNGAFPGFTKEHSIHRLIYYEELEGPNAAIDREKQIQGWRREKKLALVRTLNPKFEDLFPLVNRWGPSTSSG